MQNKMSFINIVNSRKFAEQMQIKQRLYQSKAQDGLPRIELAFINNINSRWFTNQIQIKLGFSNTVNYRKFAEQM